MYKNIRNPLIFPWKNGYLLILLRFKRSKILLQASLHRLSDLLPMVSSYFGYIKIYLAMSSWKKEKTKCFTWNILSKTKEK